MNDCAFDAAAYLERIGLKENVKADEEGLERITRAQGYCIPFENFSLQLGLDISLAPEAVFNKLVRLSRGGYCFELNNLLLMALRHFGFEVRPLLARVHLRGTPTGRVHQLVLATLNGKEWLVDVGFGGGGLLAPIRLETNRVSEQDGLSFRLVDSPPYDTMLQLKTADRWQNLYSFDLTHVGEADIIVGNHFSSTHPKSFFTFTRVATLPVAGGRISLLNFTLKKVVGATEEVTKLPSGQAYLDALEENFGIRLDQPYEDLKPVRS
jgi:N-hydroxyarylamine O-acetyltransferase